MESETSLPTCYRHPDRETRLSCTACERPICTDCMTTASVGQRCPECAQPSGRSKVISADEAVRGAASGTPFTKAVIGICVALFLPMLLFRFTGQPDPIQALGLQCNGRLAVQFTDCTGSIAGGEYWRLLTSMFLHSPGFVLHIVFNMLLLWILGPAIEREVGSWAFASLYLAAGLVGSATYFFVAGLDANPALGASGAVFGLFGAWLAAGIRNRHTLQGRAMLRQIAPLIVINLVLSFVPGIAGEAHIGGFIAGFLIAFVWWRFRPEQTAGRLGIGVAVAAAAVLAVVTDTWPLG